MMMKGKIDNSAPSNKAEEYPGLLLNCIKYNRLDRCEEGDQLLGEPQNLSRCLRS
jgi:hypothetical protein